MNRVKLSLAVGLVPALLLALCSVAPAQSATPFERTGDAFVSDSGYQKVWRCQDLNQDGDYSDAGEIINFYDSMAGAYSLFQNKGISVAQDGRVYVASADRVVGLWDLNGDGDALDGSGAGNEHWMFFDGNPGSPIFNASGIVMITAANLWIDENHVFWIAVGHAGSHVVDSIIRLQDLNQDFDAQDAGEAIYYAQFPLSSIPQDIIQGPGGDLYYLDMDTAGPKGVYRLHDDDPMGVPGVIDGPSEVSLFWTPLGTAPIHSFWGLAMDRNERFYVADTTQETLYSFKDLDGSQLIDPGEETLMWTSSGPSLIRDLEPEIRPLQFAPSGNEAFETVSLLACEAQGDERILRFIDNNPTNGHFNDPGEVIEVYNSYWDPVNISNPRSIAMARGPTLMAPSTPSVTQSFTITLDAVGSGFYSLWFSDMIASIPAPPYGTLEIGIFPPAIGAELLSGAVPITGRFALPIGGTAPALAGFTAYLQAMAGPATRLELSNLRIMTFQP